MVNQFQDNPAQTNNLVHPVVILCNKTIVPWLEVQKDTQWLQDIQILNPIKRLDKVNHSLKVIKQQVVLKAFKTQIHLKREELKNETNSFI